MYYEWVPLVTENTARNVQSWIRPYPVLSLSFPFSMRNFSCFVAQALSHPFFSENRKYKRKMGGTNIFWSLVILAMPLLASSSSLLSDEDSFDFYDDGEELPGVELEVRYHH